MDVRIIIPARSIIEYKRGFIIDGTAQRENSGGRDMERFSPPAASLKKRISPPIAWNLGLTSKEPRLIKVILLGHQGVGKTGKKFTISVSKLGREEFSNRDDRSLLKESLKIFKLLKA